MGRIGDYGGFVWLWIVIMVLLLTSGKHSGDVEDRWERNDMMVPLMSCEIRGNSEHIHISVGITAFEARMKFVKVFVYLLCRENTSLKTEEVLELVFDPSQNSGSIPHYRERQVLWILRRPFDMRSEGCTSGVGVFLGFALSGVAFMVLLRRENDMIIPKAIWRSIDYSVQNKFSVETTVYEAWSILKAVICLQCQRKTHYKDEVHDWLILISSGIAWLLMENSTAKTVTAERGGEERRPGCDVEACGYCCKLGYSKENGKSNKTKVRGGSETSVLVVDCGCSKRGSLPPNWF